MYARAVLMGVVTLVALSGCATFRGLAAGETEQLLAAAGFQSRPADTGERLQDLTPVPPFKIVTRNDDGNVVYTYADPKNCKCVYVGGSKEYSAYQRLVTERQIAQQRIWTDEELRWGGWGPWYWR
jgi:hypothetical protein